MARASVGVLPNQTIRGMIAEGCIASSGGAGIEGCRVQPSGLDLTISNDMNSFVLEPGKGELAPLNEILRLPGEVHVRTDARSTYAKAGISVDVVTEDGKPIPPGYSGRMSAVIKSHCFRAKVSPGISIAQARFFRGAPQESVLRPEDVAGNGYAGIATTGGKISMRLRLAGARGAAVGYVSNRTRNVVDLSAKNHGAGFFDYVPGCGVCKIRPGELYLFWTADELPTPKKDGIPFVCEMPTRGPDSLKINAASLIEYGSWGPQALEIFPEKETVLRDGMPICDMVFYRLADTPTNGYGPHNGNRNLDRLMGVLFQGYEL